MTNSPNPGTNEAQATQKHPFWVPACACHGPMLVFVGALLAKTQSDYLMGGYLAAFAGVLMMTSLNIYLLRRV